MRAPSLPPQWGGDRKYDKTNQAPPPRGGREGLLNSIKMIKVENLCKSFRTEEVETIALDNVSFSVEDGEFRRLRLTMCRSA